MCCKRKKKKENEWLDHKASKHTAAGNDLGLQQSPSKIRRPVSHSTSLASYITCHL